MPVIKQIEFYTNPEGVGWYAMIGTIDGRYYVGLDGKIIKEPDTSGTGVA